MSGSECRGGHSNRTSGTYSSERQSANSFLNHVLHFIYLLLLELLSYFGAFSSGNNLYGGDVWNPRTLEKCVCLPRLKNHESDIHGREKEPPVTLGSP